MSENVEREIHSSEGCKITIKSKRGTGTRDQDEVTTEQSVTDPDDLEEVARDVAAATEAAMQERRGKDDPAEIGNDDG